MAKSPSFFFPTSPQSWPQSASESFNLGQNRWKICTPHPSARFGFCAASSLISGGWGSAFPFHSVQDCWYPCRNRSRDCAVLPRLLIWKTRRPWGRGGCGLVLVWCGGWRLAVGGGKFWPPYLNSVLSRQGS